MRHSKMGRAARVGAALLALVCLTCCLPLAWAAEESPLPPAATATAETGPEGGAVMLSLLGDCSIGDSYRARGVPGSLTSTIAAKGLDWPFSTVAALLQADDITAANLEVCLTDSKKPVDKAHPLIAPPANAAVLTRGGVDVVNTVNNHCFDYGTDGYADTLATLDAQGIGHFGTAIRGGATVSARTVIVEAQGLRFGFAGFSYPQESTLTAIGEQIRALRADGCDVVIVSLHWGRETYATPGVGQTRYAARVIDLGADVVWGHHPHVLQPIQFYRGKPVLFSTGNFVFGTMSQVDPSAGIFQLRYKQTAQGARLRSLTVIPCETRGSGDYRPQVLQDADAQQRVWKRLRVRKPYAGYTNLPESFLTTGEVWLKENGSLADGSPDGGAEATE
ncbi:MAG: CapA family protein [Candidatus Limiplasma sp.]|nr:CapA family protein [Candidatus Limiplasma sp.]